MLSELDDQTRLELVQGLDEHEVSRILDAMPSDHVVDVVEELPKEQADKILDLMEEEKSEEVQELLEYAENTAGRLMSHDFVAVHEFATVAQAIDHIRKAATRDDGFYVYVVDDHDHLVGIVPLHKLLTADPATPVRSVRREGVESVAVDTDQEEVARLVQRHHLIEVAVVDDDRRLLGTISVDDVIDVIRDEATEDIQRLAGVPGDETVLDPPKAVFTKRLVWRLINLATAVLAASVIGLFEGSIQEPGHPRDLHADRGLHGGHRDHPDRHGGRPGHRPGRDDGRRPDAGAPEGGLAGAHDRAGQRPRPCCHRLPMEGGLAAGVHPGRGPDLQHDRGRGRRHAGADRAARRSGSTRRSRPASSSRPSRTSADSFRFWAWRPS